MRNYFSVGEVSKMTGFTINALRHYDKIGLVKPAVVNESSNYRYYDRSQLFLFDIIAFAKTIHLPLEELSEILNKGDMTSFKDFLEELKNRMNAQIEELKLNIQNVENVQEEITNGEYLQSVTELYQRNIPERDVVTSAALPANVNNRYIKMREKLETQIRENNLTTSFEQGTIYRIVNHQVEEGFLYKGVVLDYNNNEAAITPIPGGNYLCATYTAKTRDAVWKQFLYAMNQFEVKDPLIIEQALLNDIFDPSKQAYELQVYIGEETE